MIDEIAIQQTINRYTESAGRRDWPRLLSTFTADATWELPSFNAVFTDHAVIGKAMEGFVEAMAYWVQINSPAAITVKGERATARSMIHESGKFKDRDEAMEIVGFYDDELLRTAEGWKFTRRVFNALGQHRYPLLK